MIVVDASVVLELLMHTPAAAAIERRLFDRPEPLHAPHLLDLEVAQVLRRFSGRGLLSATRGAAALQVLDAFPLVRHAHQPLLPRIWSLRRNLTAYDATYVALAEVLGATFVTRDTRVATAAGHTATVEVL